MIGWVLLLSILPSRAPAADLPTIIEQVRGEVNPLESMEYMRRIYSTDRWFTFPKFAETAQYEASAMRSAGLQRVEILSAPADGVTQVGYWTMPLAWDVRSGTLEIASPALPLESRLLADYQSIPTSVGMWSGPTPAAGITADVVELKTPLTIEDARRMDLRGKFILTAGDLRSFKWMLVNSGAVGAISGFTENPDLKDDREWINSWGDFGWAFTKKSTPLVSFSITPHEYEFLHRLLAKGPVKVKAQVDSRYYSGPYPIVTGVIPGAGGDEEVLTLGHSSEQGAQDNATGVSALLEAMATLNRLIASGKLPRPRRTIRIMTTGEMYGTMPYVQSHMERMHRTVAAMCLDTPASAYEMSGTEYTFYMDPHAAKSYVDALILKIAASYFPFVKRPWHEHAYEAGTDTYLSDPMIGVPTTWAYSG
ncbi:MAG: M28 family peptidase, partial [Bryobacteraceae bacterium]